MPIAGAKGRSSNDFSYRHEKRISAAIDKLGCGNMNDTKWKAFFEVVLNAPLAAATVRCKMLYEEMPANVKLKRVTSKWYDAWDGPRRTREIEWVEVIGDLAGELFSKLKELGQLPIVKIENGFRLVAYGPVEIK